MKKVFALVLTLTMAVSLLAACGSSKSQEQSGTAQTEQPAQAEPAALSGAVASQCGGHRRNEPSDS